jgi:adenosylhomocysteine nucleosidase
MSSGRSKVGYVTALEMESRWLGDAGGVEFVVAGMGRERAESAAKRLVERGVAGLVSWGVAGGLDPALDAGTVVLANAVVVEGGARLTSDIGWLDRLESELDGRVPLVAGTLFHSDEILSSVEQKRAVWDRWSTVAVDMESAAVAGVAFETGLPWIAVRVVIDSAATSLPPQVAEGGGEDGRLRPTAIAGLILKPWIWPDLARLARANRAAARSMRRVWSSAGPDLALHPATGGDR